MNDEVGEFLSAIVAVARNKTFFTEHRPSSPQVIGILSSRTLLLQGIASASPGILAREFNRLKSSNPLASILIHGMILIDHAHDEVRPLFNRSCELSLSRRESNLCA